MAVEVKRLLTPEDIERMMQCGQLNEDDVLELVNGEIVWLAPVSTSHGGSSARIGARLVPFADDIGARVHDSSAGFMVGENLQQLRSPDVSLVTKERLDILRQGAFARGAPDLAVEVLSEGQHGEAYARPKIAEYFAAGCKVVWFVDLRTRSVREYLAGSPEYRVYSGDAAITLDAIAPGFSCPVSSFFYD
jgi:Uma2 family endonuclease